MKWKLALLPAALVAGCAGPGTMYEWGSYQPALLDYTKSADNEKFETNLRESIAKAEEKQAVPPGIYAELGYLLMNTDRGAEAVLFFEKEKALFPESAMLMNKMIAGAANPAEGGSDAS
jgi:hypothetical protein